MGGALEGILLRIIAQRVDLRDLIGGDPGTFVDQCLGWRIGGIAVTADLPCQGECDVLPLSGGLLLRDGERRLGITALDLNDRQQLMKARRTGL